MSSPSQSPIRQAPPALIAGIQVLRDWIARSRTGRVVATGIFALVVGAIVVTLTLSYNGLCFSQGRFLSDQENFDIAIRRIMSLPCYQLMSPVAECIPPISYENVADFRAQNPDCCKFVRHNSDFAGSGIVTFSLQLFGHAARSVLVNFKINYRDEEGSSQITIGHGLVVVGNCGNLLNLGY